MSNIRIDNPKRLYQLAEQMNKFKRAFEACRDYINNSVRITLERLAILIAKLKRQIRELESKINSLNRSYSACIQSEGGHCGLINIQIGIATSKLSKKRDLLAKIERLQQSIESTYEKEVKPLEQKLSEILAGYNQGTNALLRMEYLMEQYLKFSSSIVQASLMGLNSNQSESNATFTNPAKNETQKLSADEVMKQFYQNKLNGSVIPKALPLEEKTVGANDIIPFDHWNATSEGFWKHHDKTKESYIDFVSSGKAEMLKNSPIIVYEYNGKYVQEQDGSHRIAAAQELNVPITVHVKGKWVNKS